MEYITTLPKEIKGVEVTGVNSLAMDPSKRLYAGVSTVGVAAPFVSAAQRV